MDYLSLFDKYYKYWDKVDRLRTRGGVSKHIFSLPYQLLRNNYANKVEKAAEALNDLPFLERDGRKGLIISMTSFPLRMSKLHLVVKSIMMQDVLPEKVYLYLSKEEFPDGIQMISAELQAFIPHGLEIVFVDDNLRSHKKYYYAFRDYSDKIIITIDDDSLFYRNTVSRLLELHTKFPKSVCANRIREILFDPNGEYLSYSKWGRPVPNEMTSNMLYVGVGYGAILYPPHVLDSTEVLDVALMKDLAFMADDLWLKAMQITNGVEVAAGGAYVTPIELPGSQTVSLRSVNDGQKKNDLQWGKLDKYFELKDKLLK